MATDTIELVASALQAINEQRPNDALAALNKALEIDPSSAPVRHSLGLLALWNNEPVTALNLFNEAHRLAPGVAEHAEALAILYARLGKLHDALFFGKLSPSLKGSHIPGLLPAWLGQFADHFLNIKTTPLLQSALALQAAGQYREAEAMFGRELGLDPHSADAWHGLAATQVELGKPFEALEAMRGLMALGTGAEDLTTLARVLTLCGRADAATAIHRRALRLSAGDTHTAAALLADLRYASLATPAALAEAARQWAASRPSVATPAEERYFEPLDGRPLRLGLLSGNLNSTHASLNTLTPFLQRADLIGWELTVFSHAQIEDQITRRLRHVAFDWIDIGAIDDATAALMIENADLDLLILLDDVGANDRPGLLLERPNCLVLAWAELPAIATAFGAHGVIGDAVVLGDALPAAGEHVVTLPTPMFGLGEETPAPLPPRDADDQRLIGVRARRGQFTPENCAILADVLAALPDCILLVDHPRIGGTLGFDDLVDAFALHGCSDRVASIADVTPEDAERTFFDMADLVIELPPVSDVDAAVGALCRGRPVVTLAGSLPASRKTASMLAGISLGDWAVSNPAELIEAVRGILADRPAAQDRVVAALAGADALKPRDRAKALEQALRQAVGTIRGA